jgi:hypothetical protein
MIHTTNTDSSAKPNRRCTVSLDENDDGKIDGDDNDDEDDEDDEDDDEDDDD